MRKQTIPETEVLRALNDAVRSRLPGSWSVDVRQEVRSGDLIADAILDVVAPDGSRGALVIEAKGQLTPTSAEATIAQLRRLAAELPEQELSLLVAAPYLSPGTREVLNREGVGYFDMTGNLRLTLDDPAVVFEADGAQSNPRTEHRPLRSLKGPAAARVVRALIDFAPPYTISRLAELADVPLASTYRVVSFLEPEGIVRREPRGPIEEVDWAGLIRRWAQDYSFMDSNRVVPTLDPRGALAFIEKLKGSGVRFSVTGPLATATVAPAVPSRTAYVYVDDPEDLANRLDLRPTDAGANVFLAEPYDDVVYERGSTVDGIDYAALSQVAADLLTSPGRAPVGGEELITWMERNEEQWRGR